MKDAEEIVLRNKMAEEQLIPRGIVDERLLGVFRRVPRHIFVPNVRLADAYGDFPLSVGGGQTISQPYIVALMTQLLNLKANEKILEIGTGSGYQTSILADLTKEVYSVERIAVLAETARSRLGELGYKNVRIRVGDGTEGWDEFAPYDGIIVTAGAPAIPAPLVEQLAEGGRMVIPVGDTFSQMLKVVKRSAGEVITEDISGCMFVPLIGKYGWRRE